MAMERAGVAAAKAARIANAVLRETGDEGKAIRIANSQAEKHDPAEHGFTKPEDE